MTIPTSWIMPTKAKAGFSKWSGNTPWCYRDIWSSVIFSESPKERKWEGISCCKNDHISILHGATVFKNEGCLYEFFHIGLDHYFAINVIEKAVSDGYLRVWESAKPGKLILLVFVSSHVFIHISTYSGNTSVSQMRWKCSLEKVKTLRLCFSSLFLFLYKAIIILRSQGNKVLVL